jgi:hypothetical protein
MGRALRALSCWCSISKPPSGIVRSAIPVTALSALKLSTDDSRCANHAGVHGWQLDRHAHCAGDLVEQPMTLVYVGIAFCVAFAVISAAAGRTIEAAIYAAAVLIAFTMAEITR